MDNLKYQIPDRNGIHQSLHKLSKDSQDLDKNVKKDVVTKQKTMTMDEFKKALVSYGVNSSFDGDYLTLDMKHANVKNMLDNYKDYQFPVLNKLQITTSKSNSEATNKFFNNNFPSNVNRFYFYPNDGVEYKADLSVFIDSMLPKLKQVKDYFFILQCYLTKEHFANILEHSSHLDTLDFYACFNDFDTCDIHKINYKIKNLYLSYFGHAS